MIQIKRNNLEELAQRHFVAIENYLNKSNRGYTVAKLDKLIQKIFEENEVENFNEYTFKRIVLAKPEEIDDLAMIWAKCLRKDNSLVDKFKIFITYYAYLSQKEKFFIKDKNGNVIDYKAKNLIESLNISVCPYCNRNFIKSTKEHRIDELDHFYPKSKYPLLAISFYNLIPSCKTCNQTFKKAEEISVNPYSSIPKFEFKLKICDAQFYYNKEKIKIDFTQAKQVLAKNVEVLQLEQLYNHHTDIAIELLQKSQTYSDSYIDELFRQYEGTLFRSREDVLRLALGNFVETEDFEKRPLAKLTHDIAKELGLL